MLDATQVAERAHALFRAMGDKAEAEAARRERQCEEEGDKTEAETWRRIRASIRQRRGALQG